LCLTPGIFTRRGIKIITKTKNKTIIIIIIIIIDLIIIIIISTMELI